MHLNSLNIDTSQALTNLSLALMAVIKKERQADHLVLFSDGNFTQGENPLFIDDIRKSRIFSVGFGDTAGGADLSVTGLEKNNIVYQNLNL